MGYSCAMAASFTHEAISEYFRRQGEHSSNGIPPCDIFPLGAFFERGRENSDGSVTGSIHMNVSETHCRKHSGYRIDPNGKIIRFAGLSKAQRLEIEQLGRELHSNWFSPVRK
jgi:hypothetical protein